MTVMPIQLQGRQIGMGLPPYIVAEIGINHNGDMDLARRTILAAKATGVDAVKFQNYRTEDFLSDHALTYTYISQGESVTETQFAMFKRCELSRQNLIELADYCRSLGIDMHSTPTSQAGIDDLLAAGVEIMKNGSDYLTNLPLVEAFGRTGLLTVLSTGMATLSEIDEAVRVFRATGNDRLLLLHCTSSYPTPADQVNLRRLSALSQAFGCLVGFSDHTEGTDAAVAATVLGACWIEKHFTLDRSLPGPDHRFSSDPAEMAALVRSVRYVGAAMGTGAVGPTANELINRRDFRLSCTTARAVAAGEVLSEADIVFRRPGTGIRPAERGHLIGRTVKVALPAGTTIAAGDVQ